jgi:hypothetical protein
MCLKPGDHVQTTLELARALIEQLLARGFRCAVVLADAVSGENATLIHALHQLGLRDVVATHAHQRVGMEAKHRIRTTRWRPCARVFTAGSRQERYRRATLFGRRRPIRYDQITTDPVHLPPATTGQLMTNLPGTIEQSVGNRCGWRTQDPHTASSKRMMNVAGPLVGAPTRPRLRVGGSWCCAPTGSSACRLPPWSLRRLRRLSRPWLFLPPPGAAPWHPAWTDDASWQHRLNHLRLLLQPYVCACLLLPWRHVYPLPHLAAGLADRCALMNTYHPLCPP